MADFVKIGCDTYPEMPPKCHNMRTDVDWIARDLSSRSALITLLRLTVQNSQLSYTYPKPVLQVLVPKSQVPSYCLHGPLGIHKGLDRLKSNEQLEPYARAGSGSRLYMCEAYGGYLGEQSRDSLRMLKE